MPDRADTASTRRAASESAGLVAVLDRIARGSSAPHDSAAAVDARRAMAEFYDATSTSVYGFCVKVLRDRSLADDVAPEVYYQAWRTVRQYDATRGDPLAWVLTIARSRSIDRVRSDRRRQGVLDEIADSSPSAGIAEPPCDPFDASSGRQRRELVRRALAELPENQREIIELAYFRGLSQTEIARAIGEPLGTVKSRTRLGMSKLRDSLGALGGDL